MNADLAVLRHSESPNLEFSDMVRRLRNHLFSSSDLSSTTFRHLNPNLLSATLRSPLSLCFDARSSLLSDFSVKIQISAVVFGFVSILNLFAELFAELI